MKRFLLLLTISFITLAGYTQLLVKGDFINRQGASGVNSIVLFSKIDNNSEIHYKAANPGATVRWFSFSNGVRTEIRNFSRLSSSHTYIDPQDNTGYIVIADGKETVLWVMDVSRAKDAGNLMYETPGGEKLMLESYNRQDTKIPNKTGMASDDGLEDEPGDEDTPDEIGCRITTDTTPRDSLNENQRPTITTLEGSAPLQIQFYSNPTGDVQNYLWQFYKDGNMFLTRTEQDHSYTFTETGRYKIVLKVSNDTKEASDSIEVGLSESSIAVPKIFTPNGDGFNDEFRIAYTSLTEFDATILNRWGRVVYRWNDPQSGWDGTINGKPAAEGTYFYIIRAKGSDNKPYTLKGHINLLR